MVEHPIGFERLMNLSPNKAGNRLVDALRARFRAGFLPEAGFRQNGIVSSRPHAGNANR